jgi:hypothetical protein
VLVVCSVWCVLSPCCTTHKRTQWSQSIIGSGQNQLKYTYQLQQGDTTHYTKHTTTHRKVTLMLNNPSLQNKTTDVVTHRHSCKLLKMDILMSKTCWAHNKWNKIASDFKLVFHSSTVNLLTPNDSYMGRTAPLTSKRFILYFYSTNIDTEYFKYALYSQFFSLQNAVCFIMLTCLVPVLFTFYIQGVLKLK